MNAPAGAWSWSGRRRSPERDINALFERLGNAGYQLETLGSGKIYDISMISAPVFDPQGRVAVAITLAGLPQHLEAAVVVEFAETVTSATSATPSATEPG